MSRKSIPTLKPLVILLAAAFPIAGNATPSVSASGSYRIDPNPYAGPFDDPGVVQTGSFNEAATSGAFNRSVSNVPDYANSWWTSAVNMGAYSNGAGHFGASIDNRTIMYSPQRAEAQIKLTDTITNATSRAQNVLFNFNISSLNFVYEVGMMSFGGTKNRASFSASVLVDGRTVWATSFSAEPINNGIGWTATGANIGLGLASRSAAGLCMDFGECGFSVMGYHKSLNLGPLAAFSSMNVTYVIDLATETDTYGGAPSIHFDDPVDLSGIPDASPSASLQFAAPVPEPETAGMMAAGLALLGAAGARRRRKQR